MLNMQLNHYLNFKGQSEAAFNFYKSVFGGEFSNLTRYSELPQEDGVKFSEQEKNYLLHVEILLFHLEILTLTM